MLLIFLFLTISKFSSPPIQTNKIDPIQTAFTNYKISKNKDDLLRFARSNSHHNLIKWLFSSNSIADGGFIRLYNAEENGYSNGIWRAEDETFRPIENFTNLSNEDIGPKV